MEEVGGDTKLKFVFLATAEEASIGHSDVILFLMVFFAICAKAQPHIFLWV